MRYVAVLLAFAGALTAQEGPKLNLVVVEGDGAINNIRQRTAREPIVQVEDQNHKPVAGVAVVFSLPEHGAGGTFANGAHSLTVVTDNSGRAVARGLQVNRIQGQYQINVRASFQGQTASTTISQTNVAATAATTTTAAAGVSTKLLVILGIVAVAGTVGGLYASHTIGGGGGIATPSAVTIAPGTGTVGPPR